MVFILFDNPADEKNMEFLKHFAGTDSFATVFPAQKCNTVKSIVKACKEALDNSSEGDTLLFWYDFMGIVCWWVCKLLHKKREIVVLNILLKDKRSLKNKVAKFLYKYALRSADVRATVTSLEYGHSINKLLGINKEFILLHDIYYGEKSICERSEIKKERSVFCGGRNGRDWRFLLKLAEEMSDVEFNVVIPKEQVSLFKDSQRENVHYQSEIPTSEFLKMMCRSSLVVMPLDTEAPAGLIVMFQATANGKMVVTSDTVTTREYFKDQQGELCSKDIHVWKERIGYWLDHIEEANARAERMRKFLETECSEKRFAETLQRIVNER